MASKSVIQHLVDDINSVIDKYRNSGLSVGETIGAFQMAILDIYHEDDDIELDPDHGWDEE